jgi:hypothetical protein
LPGGPGCLPFSSFSCAESWPGPHCGDPETCDEFGFEAYKAINEGRIIPLFAIDNKKHLQFFVIDGMMKPASGWTIISLVQPEAGNSADSTTCAPGARVWPASQNGGK